MCLAFLTYPDIGTVEGHVEIVRGVVSVALEKVALAPLVYLFFARDLSFHNRLYRTAISLLAFILSTNNTKTQ